MRTVTIEGIDAIAAAEVAPVGSAVPVRIREDGTVELQGLSGEWRAVSGAGATPFRLDGAWLATLSLCASCGAVMLAAYPATHGPATVTPRMLKAIRKAVERESAQRMRGKQWAN